MPSAVVDFGALCVILPTLYYVGQLAQKARMPLITGYMLGGVLCGPYGLNVLHAQALASFSLVENTCLAVIAMAAGSELSFVELRRTGKQVGITHEGVKELFPRVWGGGVGCGWRS